LAEFEWELGNDDGHAHNPVSFSLSFHFIRLLIKKNFSKIFLPHLSSLFVQIFGQLHGRLIEGNSGQIFYIGHEQCEQRQIGERGGSRGMYKQSENAKTRLFQSVGQLVCFALVNGSFFSFFSFMAS
jgi:hypothetical protein